ncbi:transposon Ty3 gag-pol polyprotein [Trifolium pratense]|uniref:Transposon Ty3 gag-pol polyprotein n=1 Tax=Trifolium pratense TaxID=57577 RepID=A0A2K3LYL2_TRIPR|nr:transposon Ty3 gag-pol polyprotein [Trifolium pratense]
MTDSPSPHSIWKALETRFAPSYYDDPSSSLFKLPSCKKTKSKTAKDSSEVNHRPTPPHLSFQLQPTLHLLLPITPPRVIFRKLSPEEMATRREKVLCYNCDETFTPTHKCKGRFFLLISEDEIDADKLQPSPSIDPPTIDPPQIATEPSDGQISFHALSGCTDPATIRIAGRIFDDSSIPNAYLFSFF